MSCTMSRTTSCFLRPSVLWNAMAWRLMLDSPTMSWSMTIRCPTPPRASASTQFEPTPPRPMTMTVAASTRSRPALVMMTSSFSVGVPRRVRTRSDSAISSRVRGAAAATPAEGAKALGEAPAREADTKEGAPLAGESTAEAAAAAAASAAGAPAPAAPPKAASSAIAAFLLFTFSAMPSLSRAPQKRRFRVSRSS